MGKRVDAESSLLDEPNTENTAINESADPVTPHETTEDGREDESHDEDRLDVVAVLPDNNGILVEIGDVSTTNSLGVLLHDHPAQVGVEETLADGVGILLGVGITVMGSVIPGPPADRAFSGTSADGGEVDSEERSSLV